MHQRHSHGFPGLLHENVINKKLVTLFSTVWEKQDRFPTLINIPLQEWLTRIAGKSIITCCFQSFWIVWLARFVQRILSSILSSSSRYVCSAVPRNTSVPLKISRRAYKPQPLKSLRISTSESDFFLLNALMQSTDKGSIMERLVDVVNSLWGIVSGAPALRHQTIVEGLVQPMGHSLSKRCTGAFRQVLRLLDLSSVLSAVSQIMARRVHHYRIPYRSPVLF